MKFSATVAALVAPLALAKAVHNAFPPKRDMALMPQKEKFGMSSAGGGGSDKSSYGLSGWGITANAVTQVIIIWINPGNNAAQTPVNPSPPLESAPTAPKTHEVVVGGPSGLIYTPNSIKADVGDMVVFTFMSANHTATQSGFTEPCSAMPGGMDTGFQANANNSINPPPQVAMQVAVATPLWFYCKQKGHCGKGMVFSINPTPNKTHAMFQSMAIAQNGAGGGTAITSGTPPAAPQESAASPPPSAAPPAAPPAAPNAQTGSGSVQGGACVCAVTCSVGSFPVQAQGIGAFGGLSGALPMNMTEPMMNS